MKHFLKSTVFTASLAIFSMLFGAGNLIYPIKGGLNSSEHIWIGLIGFLLTAVLLPLLGLITIILFNGNYHEFFARLGKIPGALGIFISMAIIGPFIAMPRIVSISHIMLEPFIGNVSPLAFTLTFLICTFLATYRKSKIIDLLGNLISPALLLSLGYILIKGLFTNGTLVYSDKSTATIFYEQALLGYNHLDLFGGIFFGSIVLNLLKNAFIEHNNYNLKSLAWVSMQAGIIGSSLLALVYTGMFFLGQLHGNDVYVSNLAKLFSNISFKVVGPNGAFIVATAVAMACYSTIIALASVLTEYVHKELSKGVIPYASALTLVLGITFFMSGHGLDTLLKFSEPVIITFYPVLITLTICNLGYKLFNFKPVILPVLITLACSICAHYYSYLS